MQNIDDLFLRQILSLCDLITFAIPKSSIQEFVRCFKKAFYFSQLLTKVRKSRKVIFEFYAKSSIRTLVLVVGMGENDFYQSLS